MEENTSVKTTASTYINNIVSDTQMWTLQRVSTVLKSVDIDTHFQSPARWSSKQMKDYMHSLFMGTAPSKYVFADVARCLKESQAGNQDGDVEYYSKWFNSYPNSTLFLNLDSNNRFSTLRSLFTGQLKLRPGTYRDSDLNEYKIKPGETWPDLSPDIKKFILSREITIELYTKATRAQLSDIFLAVNRGTPLNDAEKRNSIISDISKVCRNLGEKYFKNELTASSCFRKAFANSEHQYNRRLVDAWFTNCAFIYQNNVHRRATPSLLEDSYQPDSPMDRNHKKIQDSIDDFFENWITPNSSLLMKRPSVNILLDLYVLKLKYGDRVSDINKFVEGYWTVVKSLIDDRKTQHFIGERSFTYNEMLRGREASKTETRNKILLEKLDDKKLVEPKKVIEVESGVRKLVSM
jgi:hypothetical protein